MKTVGVEGIDGAGKTSMLDGLVARLKDKGYSAKVLHLNSLLRKDAESIDHSDDVSQNRSPKASALYGLSELLHFYEQEIEKAAMDHDVVLVDRYKHSYVVRRVLRGCEADEMTQLARENIPSLDLTIYMKADPMSAYRRIQGDAKRTIKQSEVFPNGKPSRDGYLRYQKKAVELFDSLCSDPSFGGRVQIVTSTENAPENDISTVLNLLTRELDL